MKNSETQLEKPLVIYSEISNFSQMPEYFLHYYHTHLLCMRGFVEFKYKSKKMRCSSGEFFFWFAESRVSEIRFSKNFKGKILLVEKNFLTANFPDLNWSISATLYSREHPVKHLHSEKDRKKIQENFSELYNRFLETEHRFYDEILRLQMQIFILEMWNLFAKDYEQRQSSLQSGTLYERFTLLLQAHCSTEREVQFYAEKLNITPKYLNLISKKTSGITASEWIQRYAKDHLVLLLENRNLSLSQISDIMNFSSQSFFTRYVKKLLGMTPSDFRQRLT